MQRSPLAFTSTALALVVASVVWAEERPTTTKPDRINFADTDWP